MPRLIDADKLLDILDVMIIGHKSASDVYDVVDSMPTVDVVRHGHWIYRGKRGRFPVCECSECGNAENADWAILGNNVNYCPNCGAKMDEVKDV